MDSAYRMGLDSRAVPQKALRSAEVGTSADSAAKTEGTEDSVGPAQHPARWEPAARADLEWVRTASELWGAVAAAVVAAAVVAAVALAAVPARQEAVAAPENRLRMAGRTAVAAVVEEAAQCTPVQYRRWSRLGRRRSQ